MEAGYGTMQRVMIGSNHGKENEAVEWEQRNRELKGINGIIYQAITNDRHNSDKTSIAYTGITGASQSSGYPMQHIIFSADWPSQRKRALKLCISQNKFTHNILRHVLCPFRTP